MTDGALHEQDLGLPGDLRLDLVKGSISYHDAVFSEHNMLRQLSYPEERFKSCVYLLQHLETLAAVVAFHLCIDPRLCEVTDPEEWNHGSFNWSIPVRVNWKNRHKVILRIPLPYKFGHQPHRTDEKTRCEAATYAVMQTQCPDVPVPKLWGFGLTDGTTFTSLENVSLISRIIVSVQNVFRAVLRRPGTCQFVARKSTSKLGLSYLVLDHIEGELLSASFKNELHNKVLRTNLFTDLSRIMLSIAKVQHSRIGSFTLDNNGVVSLSNRPLTLRIPILETEGVPALIPPSKTYESTETYILDMLSYHDGRILHQPNSINDEEDAQQQMETLCHMRSILPHCILPECRNGPFMLTLTDIHPSNIFVDNDWHVKALIDLEGAGVLPSELTQPPYWITGQDVDNLIDDNLTEFESRRFEFMSIFSREEHQMFLGRGNLKTKLIQRSWSTGASWYLMAIQSNGLYNLFHQHIQKLYGAPRETWRYWRKDAADIICNKLRDKEKYLQELEKLATEVWRSP